MDAMATCSVQDESNLQELPVEVLRLLGTYLSLADVLATRAVCTSLATGLAPLVTSLRVPLVQLCGDQHPVTPPNGTPGGASPAQPVSGGPASFAGLAAATPAAEQLSAVLKRLCNVSRITLILTSTTTGQDLQQALEAVGAEASNIWEVAICELLDSCTGLQDDRPRAYCADLQLHHLCHVGVLRIETVSWDLQDIWQQVATLAFRLLEGNSCSIAASDGSDISSSTTGECQGCAVRPYRLHTLVIKPLGSRLHHRHCNLKHQRLPTQLTHLTTPLPGQFSHGGEVVCPLNTAHESYVAELAAQLPELQSLIVSDTFEGREQVFEGFRQLEELTCKIGERFRSMPYETHTDTVREAASYNLATCMGRLKRLDLLGPPDTDSSEPQVGLQTQRAPRFAVSSPFEQFRLCWLQHNTNLQHLAACLLQTDEDVSATAGQLRSLTACCGLPAPELLAQIAAVGSGLTSLALHSEGALWRRELVCYAPAGGPLAMLTSLHSLVLTAEAGVLYMVADPAALWAHLPSLQHLELERVGLSYSRTGQLSTDREVALCAASRLSGQTDEASSRPVLWLMDLPCQQLQHLWLSGYQLVLPPGSSQLPQAEGLSSRVGGSSSSSCLAGGYSRQDSHDGQQQHSQLVHDVEGLNVLPDLADLNLQQQGTNASFLRAKGLCELSKLTNLTLHNCKCLCLQQDPAGGSCSREAVTAPVHHLLGHLLPPAGVDSKLHNLRLQSVPLCLADVFFITCSPLSRSLQHLELRATQWLPPQPPAACSTADGQQHLHQQPSEVLGGLLRVLALEQEQLRGSVPQLPVGTCVGDVLAAAAQAGRLRYLRTLVVDVCKARVQDGIHAWQRVRSLASCQGLSLLSSCTDFAGLQQLQLVVNADGYSPTGQSDCATKLGCCCGWLADPMPCSQDQSSDLSPVQVELRQIAHRLQQLRELKLTVLCMHCADCGPAGDVAGQSCEAVVKECLPGCYASVDFVAANMVYHDWSGHP